MLQPFRSGGFCGGQRPDLSADPVDAGQSGQGDYAGGDCPETASVQPGSANLQSFLKNWQPAQSGPGAGSRTISPPRLKGWDTEHADRSIDFIGSCLAGPIRRQQLAAALGQAPGQPGSPAGRNPSAGAAVAPPAAAGPPGGSGGPPQAPPQPQAYQSPPDLAQAYMALMQRDQASNDFYNGARRLLGGAVSGAQPGAWMKWAAAQQDAGSTMSDLVKIQQSGSRTRRSWLSSVPFPTSRQSSI